MQSRVEWKIIPSSFLNVFLYQFLYLYLVLIYDLSQITQFVGTNSRIYSDSTYGRSSRCSNINGKNLLKIVKKLIFIILTLLKYSSSLSYDFDSPLYHTIIFVCHAMSRLLFLDVPILWKFFLMIRLSYTLIVFCIPFLFVHLSIFDLWIGIQLSETICCRNSRRRREGKDSERNPVSSGCWRWWYYDRENFMTKLLKYFRGIKMMKINFITILRRFLPLILRHRLLLPYVGSE